MAVTEPTTPEASQEPVDEEVAPPEEQAPEAPAEEQAPEEKAPIDWEAETRKAREEAAARRIELRELQEKTKDAKSVEEVTALIGDFEQKVQAAELAAARERAGRKYGLPDAVVGRLQGDDEEAILADAETFSELFSARKPTPPAPLPPSGGRTPKDPADEMSPAEAWAKARAL